jgi:methylenetetrahydrofolate dehydrogenase (NADP+)/methenyltetrahydrofolate cyclohydrolase
MEYQILDGKLTSKKIKEEIAEEVQSILKAGGRAPHLAAVLVGTDGASETYVGHKVKACEQVGFQSTLIRFDENISEEELLNKIYELNKNEEIDGFIVQLPLPSHINEDKVIEAINPKKTWTVFIQSM